MTQEEAKLVLDSLTTWVGQERLVTDEIVEAIRTLSKPSLPSNMDDAAKEIATDILGKDYLSELDEDCAIDAINEATTLVKAGAYWMAGLGITVGGTFHHSCGYPSVIELNTYLGDYEGKEVTVQIRKK